MKGYLDISTRYLSAHKKKTRLSILSIVMSVALVTGIFSMLDVFLEFEKIQIMHDRGNYHIYVKDASGEEAQAIKSRIDVKNAGMFMELGRAVMNGVSSELGALDENFSGNMYVDVIEGRYPAGQDEIMVEKWACDERFLNTGLGETVSVVFPDGAAKNFTVSGICADLGSMKASGIPGAFMSMDNARSMYDRESLLLVEFKNRVNVRKAEQEIISSLSITKDRIGENNYLLAVIGQSDHNAAVGIYQTGAILFLIVLIAGVIMIYNTFNISVMERVRQFGLLRCVGASKAQIRKLVKREGLTLLLRALPLGILLGMVVTFFCCAVLKFYNSYLFSDIPLFNVSPAGILAGVTLGIFTVAIATRLPAKKAARVSPVNAVTGSSDIQVPKARKQGLLTKLFPVETAMGISNAVMKKKTLFLMSASIAISIIMFLGFNSFVDFLHSSMKTTKPYTPDISLTSKDKLSSDLYSQLSGLNGVKRVYGNMFGYADTTFDAARLTETYKKELGGIKAKDNGLFDAPEKSWFISYDKNQLNWSKTDLLEGNLSENDLNEHNGIIAVLQNVRKGVTMQTAELKAGDKVYIETVSGTRVYTVMAVLRSVPFNDSSLNLATFITTEKQFTEITGSSQLLAINIQLKNKSQDETISEIKQLIGKDVLYLDSRQKNNETNQTFFTMAIFIYGFVAVIALISILNIISTMNTSVASKTKYLGVLRAVGMSGKQLDTMVMSEAATYCIVGCVFGCIIGVLLQKALVTDFLSAIKIIWRFPLMQIVCVLAAAFIITGLSIVNPLKKVKAKGISEVIGSL